MIGTIILYALLVGAGGYVLIKASQYVNGVGDVLNYIWEYITNNLFGFLIIFAVVIFLIYVISKIDFNKVKLPERKRYDKNKMEAESVYLENKEIKQKTKHKKERQRNVSKILKKRGNKYEK